YLWHWPIRAMHWVAALCVVVLVVTGLYIGRPYFMTGGEPSSHFLMGWMRFLHFAAAGVLVATAIIRAYWLFVGNRFERWRALFPVSGKDWRNLVKVVKAYLFIRPHEAPQYMGHNPIQQLSYTFIYLLAFLQVMTGFALYGLSDPGGLFFTAFSSWIGPLFGGFQVVRFFHHVVTWIFLIFIPVHVYLTVRADVVHRESRMTSIVSGMRYVRDDIEFVDEE
ncbi:MAG: Ni/Fe-hydrogenase, b-type cytochrome subunit, partial [Gemmatimonadetes bacterium]|nr:Ni/Fe-hydrogenase, b-type cytochrome subunit [Gemmatimonadota bacterium]NIR78546.1 Ni/Fe-hydrogenase, b-type cytochrome subunit [Gemmatimonadota bacterium]NIT87169.1 Ni/Fe-hydrogenase, b-type cytochrome subunit [Gemmatimonadota bacterium]NIU31000.1 Ni/Fe-hydrogenase, b-type cytochrome subunit [Gemmatimonadota bacterium]NIU35754.1 Ni/Fe-hydrogenase, b-type cytochrome subunit [Gemmatimonadota bacterium]